MFLKNINKSLARLIKKKKDWNKILNEGEDIANDRIQEQRIVRDFDEQLYTKKSDNLTDTDKFLFVLIYPKAPQIPKTLFLTVGFFETLCKVIIMWLRYLLHFFHIRTFPPPFPCHWVAWKNWAQNPEGLATLWISYEATS